MPTRLTLLTAGLMLLGSFGPALAQGALSVIDKKPAAGILCLADHDMDGSGERRSPFDNATADGVIFRTGWMLTEPRANAYEWGQIDRHMQAAKRSGKIFGLAIGAGRGTPRWFLQSSPTTLTITQHRKGFGQRQVTMPVPWDRAFQDRWGEFLQAVAARYDGEPNLAYVVIAGVGISFEPVMARSPEDVRNFEAMGGLPRWIEGTKAVIDLYARHFRKTPFLLSMHLPVRSAEAQRAIEAVVDYGLRTYPGRFGVQNHGLDAVASTSDFYHRTISEWSGRTTVGYQMVWSSVGVNAEWLRGSLGDVLRRGAAMKAHFVEVYAVDCDDPKYADVLRQASSALRANATAFRR